MRRVVLLLALAAQGCDLVVGWDRITFQECEAGAGGQGGEGGEGGQGEGGNDGGSSATTTATSTCTVTRTDSP